MTNTPQAKRRFLTFYQKFESTRVELGVPISSDSVEAVFSVITNTNAKHLLIDLVLDLQIQSKVANGTDLANIFKIGSSVFANCFDFKLAIPLVEQLLNDGSDESVFKVVAELAARLPVISMTTSPDVISKTQTSAEDKADDSNSSRNDDEPKGRESKRVKRVYRDSNCETNYGSISRNYSMEVSNTNDCDEEPTTEEPPMFRYRPLDSARREIRLLVLHPSEEINSYSCSLIYVSMEEDPDYEALSYVWGSNHNYDPLSYLWGSKPNQRNISIDGRRFSVTANLGEALDHLYHNDRPRRLWVDAICINQKDIPERSQQVQNMTEIYSRARNVVVWIGVLGIMTQHLLHRLENEDDDPSLKHLRGFTASGSRIEGNVSAFEEEDKRLLNELAQNAWFTRVWVIQEVAVARKVIAQTGRTVISWAVFGAALEKCNSNHDMKSVIDALITINTIRNARSRKPYYMDLFFLLQRFRHCLATDERDKVFALLGLASSSLAEEKVLHVIPDYSKPAIDIYLSLTRQYINRRRNLDILCHAEFSNIKPTWVPNWSCHNPGLSVLPKRRIVGAGYEPMYRCCGDLEVDRELIYSTDRYRDRLWLTGFKFDVVSIVGTLVTKVQDLGLEAPVIGVNNVIKEWKTLSEICSHMYGSDLEQAFRRTLHADAIGEKRWQENSNDYSAIPTIEASKDNLVTGNITSSSPEFVCVIEGSLGTVEGKNLVTKEEELNSKRDLAEASMKRAAIKRAFFVTEKGYMGLGPFHIEEGDLVYVLSGGQVPFILRPVNAVMTDRFFLVGESYVHGIMDGEATMFESEIETIYLV